MTEASHLLECCCNNPFKARRAELLADIWKNPYFSADFMKNKRLGKEGEETMQRPLKSRPLDRY